MIAGGIEAISLPRFVSEKYASFDDYISKNLDYPANAKNKGIEEEVIVEFTVTKNGEIKNPKIIKGPCRAFMTTMLPRLIELNKSGYFGCSDWLPSCP